MGKEHLMSKVKSVYTNSENQSRHYVQVLFVSGVQLGHHSWLHVNHTSIKEKVFATNMVVCVLKLSCLLQLARLIIIFTVVGMTYDNIEERRPVSLCEITTTPIAVSSTRAELGVWGNHMMWISLRVW